MKHYKYCGEKKEDIHYFEDFVENFVDPEEVFISIEEEEECCNEQPPSCVSCYRNENLRYCGEDYPELGVYKGDHYDDVIDSIINYTNNTESTVLVKYEDGTVIELVTLTGGEHKEVIVPDCLPSTVEIYNSDGTLLQTLEMIPGTSQNYECPDAQIFETDDEGNETVIAILPSGTQTNLDDIPCRSTELTIVNTNGDVISEIELQSGETDEYILPNTIHSVTVKDQNSNILDSESYSLYSSVDNGNSDITLNIPNGTVEVKNSDGDIVDTVVVPYGQTVDGNAPDATYTLTNTVPTTITSGNIVSNGSSIIIAPDAIANLEDEDGNPISSTTIPSGSVDTLVALNGTVIVEYADGTPIQTVNVLSGGSDTVVIPVCEDSTVDIEDTGGNTLYSLNIPSGSSSNQIINDSIVILKDTDGNTLSTTNILAESTENIIAPDAIVEVKDQYGNLLDSVSANSGTITTVVIPHTLVEWALQFVNTNDVVLVYATAGNIVTFNSGTGTDVGSISVSTDGINYSALTFPFTPVAGYYWFKRSTSLVTGEYIISE